MFVVCPHLTSITISSSVTSISDYAFYGCTSLTSIDVINTNTYYSSLDGVLFNKDQTIIILYPIGKTSSSYTIPNTVTTIGDSAFISCAGLTSITISDSVTSIGQGAFIRCTGLTSITITNSVTSIGNFVFFGCTGLSSITIPDSVTIIGDYAFYDCIELRTIFISNAQAVLLGNQLGYTWTSSTSPGISIQTPEFYNAPNNVFFILP